MAADFADHFSARAADYARYRPSHSPALIDHLAALAPARDTAWDAGCGSGQFSTLLAARFHRVLATDASAEQLRHATPHERVEYRCARAEDCGLADRSVDLAVAAQAAHWFDLDRWYAEVRRVARPGAILALVNYRLAFVTPTVDSLVARLHEWLLREQHWPPERLHVENDYRTLPFPFAELAAPSFELHAQWTASEFLGYVATWSAVRSVERRGDHAMLRAFTDDCTRAWGSAERRRAVRWPVALRLARL